jgi:hypothetical protein
VLPTEFAPTMIVSAFMMSAGFLTPPGTESVRT